MRISINAAKWYEDACAAFLIFTRIPFGRIAAPPSESYRRAISYWPLTGWTTAAVMAAVLYFSAIILPYPLAVLSAIGTRMLLTGARQERQMRDFIATASGSRLYGNTAWALYELLLYVCLAALNAESAAITIIAADPFSKMISGQIVQMLPHEPQSDSRWPQVAFNKLSIAAGIRMFLFGILPLLLFFYMAQGERWDLILFLPCIVMYFLYLLIMKTRRGYSAESLGMLSLLNELAVYLIVTLQAIL